MKIPGFSPLIRLFAVAMLAWAPAAAPALFSSGSTGADGALNVTEDTTLPIPPDGVFNHTTINVAQGATLRFDISERNLPIIMLAQDDVTIDGTIDLSGENGRQHNDPLAGTLGGRAAPGPGGYHGGIGGQSPANTGDDASQVGMSGGGPGGGRAADNPTPEGAGLGRGGNGGSHFTAGAVGTGNSNQPLPIYGDMRLITLSGGSGGAGGNFFTPDPTSSRGPSGGAGGGAILIASSTSITVNGTITARGGNGGSSVGTSGGGSRGGGAGAGGAIRLMAQTIAGSGSLEARGGSGVSGGNGLIRIEAIDQQGTLAPNSNPPPAITTPGLVSVPPSLQPRVRIASIGGTATPDDPAVSLTAPDVVIPAATGDPVTIGIETENVPDGAVVTLRIPVQNGGTIFLTSTPVASGTATAQTAIPEGAGAIYATVALPDP